MPDKSCARRLDPSGLVIGRNIPIAEFVERLAGFDANVVVEFVGDGDPMVAKLLRNRAGQDIEYSAEAPEHAFARHFGATIKEPLESGSRTLYYAQTPDTRDTSTAQLTTRAANQ